MIPINEIRENYNKHTNARIIHLAQNESRGLRQEVIPILFSEIERRGLDKDLVIWVKAERRQLTQVEFQNIKHKIETATCTICGSVHRKLEGFTTSRITGFLIGVDISNEKMIACNKCRREKKRNTILWTSFFGWWSPEGFISTPFVLIGALVAPFQKEKINQEVITEFIDQNIGTITLENDSQEIIDKLLIEFNKDEA